MKLTEHFLTENDCYTGGRTIVPKGVMVHSTGVAQPNAAVFLSSWNRPGVEACVHAFVTPDGVTQTLPWLRRGWHAGKAASGKVSANNTHLSFEICEPTGHTYNGGTMVGYDVAKNAAYFAKVYHNAVELTAMLCKLNGLDPQKDGVVICHSEGHARGIASNHADVTQWFPKHGKSMDDFRADVAQAMRGEEDDMTVDEVQKIVDTALERTLPTALAAALEAQEQTQIYQRLEDVPEWGRPTVDKLIALGALKGDENGALNLTRDLLRSLVILQRADS